MDKKKTVSIIAGVVICLAITMFLVMNRNEVEISSSNEHNSINKQSESNIESGSKTNGSDTSSFEAHSGTGEASNTTNQINQENEQGLDPLDLRTDPLEFYLVGHVFDPHGNPVSDAEIILQQTGIYLPAGYDVFTSAEVPLVIDIENLTTDKDGYYSTRLSEPLPLQVKAMSPGFPDDISIVDQNVLVTSGTLENQIQIRHDIHFDLGRIAAFQVVDQHDTFLENVNVQYFRKHNVLSTRSDDEGYFELNLPQDMKSLFIHLEYDDVTKKNYHIRLQEGVQKIVLPVIKGSVEGTVVFEGTGEPVANAVVELNSSQPENTRNVFPLRYLTTSETDGSFRFENLISNRWLVSATLDGLEDEDTPVYGSEQFTLGEEEQRKDIVIELPTSSPTWNVRVLEARSDKPVEGAYFSSLHNVAYPDALMNLKSAPDGSFDVSHLIMTDEQFWNFLTASYINAEGYEKKLVMPTNDRELRSKAVESKSLDIKIYKGKEIFVHGRITDADGKPVQGAVVQDFNGFDDHLLQSDAIDVTDKEGIYALKLLKANEFVLQITHKDFTNNYSRWLDVDKDRVEYNHTMYTGGNVLVKVTDPEGLPLESTTVKLADSWRLNYGQKTGPISSKVTDESGEVLFKNWQATDGVKPPGVSKNNTRLLVYHSEYQGLQKRDFEIIEGETTELLIQLQEKDTSGYIDGYILDGNRNKLEGAKVVLYNLDLNQYFETWTDALGFFKFENVASTNYGVSASYSGYYPRTEFIDLPATEFELMLAPWPEGIKH